MTRWSPGPPGFYDDYGLGLGRYRAGTTQLIGHHGVWGAFAFWSPELDALISGNAPASDALTTTRGSQRIPGPRTGPADARRWPAPRGDLQ
jgi:hypothetical protein